MKRTAYELYDANLSIRENAQKLGCSEAALRKYLKNTGVDRRYDAYYVRWKRIKDFFEANPSATLVQVNQELGYSPHTIRKYKSISEQELEEAFRDTIKVSNFDIRNKNSIKSISYDQTEILAWIMRLYNNRQPFDCDLTASKCIFWKSLPKPEYLFDINPQIEGVKLLSEADKLKDNSLNSVVFDLPFIVSSGAMSKIKERFSHFETLEELYEANLANRSDKDGKVRFYDSFRNRVMVPIIDARGNVVAFGGRVLDDSKPKYINSSDTLVYKKSLGVFGLNFAKNSKENAPEVVRKPKGKKAKNKKYSEKIEKVLAKPQEIVYNKKELGEILCQLVQIMHTEKFPYPTFLLQRSLPIPRWNLTESWKWFLAVLPIVCLLYLIKKAADAVLK